MADLRKKLARLAAKADSTEETVEREPVLPIALDPVEDEYARERKQRIEELRERVRALANKPSKRAERASYDARERALSALPFVRVARSEGAIDVRSRVYEVTTTHGRVPLKAALAARAEAIAMLAIDQKLEGFDPNRALFIDTETTGLSGGTGMMAFLVGAGRFKDGRFVVEQWFLRDPSEEPALLCALRERIEESAALVSFNGKAFDLPLLRARFIMNRLAVPKTPPHLDLVHVARRIYGKRMDQCRLVHLERDVLGFVRQDDVYGSEIPSRYSAFLRHGDAEGLLPVIEHNLWDVVAMAALVGELAARVTGDDAVGRFEPSDMAGLANTALRAGAHALAARMARMALDRASVSHDRTVTVRAAAVAAKVHRRRGEHGRSKEALRLILEHAPDDPWAHLELSKLYEHKYRDPWRALEHARRAIGAENDDAMAKRLARLEARVRTSSLKLPGSEDW